MSVDWHDQWERFAPGFKKGVLPVSLKRFKVSKLCDEVVLQPGPGFGDLSHDTTKLTLDLLAPLVSSKALLDIGSGSGILSLVGYALGANAVLGIDIDPEAVEHAMLNAKLNGFEKDVQFSLPSVQLPPFLEGVIAMNMISSEQERAWESLPRLSHFVGELVISGLLREEESVGISRFVKRGWRPVKIKKSSAWLAIHFTKL